MGPWVLLATLFATGVTNAQTKRMVHVEVSADAGAPLETQQKWMEVLSGIGADRVRSQTARSSNTVRIEESESSVGTLIKVFGVIEGNQLSLPGASFQLRDSVKLENYIQKLRDDGANVALAEKKAFGLTSQQLVSLNQRLAAPLTIETRNHPAQLVEEFVARRSGVVVELDASAKSAFKRNEPVFDDLKGLSLGTALAAAIRPLGLVLVPHRRQGNELTLRIVDSKNASEHWPIGWPPGEIPKNTVPKLFEKNLLEIRDFPLDQVLAAVQAKAEVTMLFDYNSLARAEIDLASTKVTFVKANSSYGFALRKMLGQTDPRLAYEIRVDEAERPFLWISTAVPIK